MKNWIKTMLFVSALCLAACSDDPDVAPLKRDTDAVELTYNSGATTQISVRYAGSWSARVECTDGSGAPVNNWFSATFHTISRSCWRSTTFRKFVFTTCAIRQAVCFWRSE